MFFKVALSGIKIIRFLSFEFMEEFHNEFGKILGKKMYL